MLKVGSKIKLVKEIPWFNRVGDIFEVTALNEEAIYIKASYGMGIMSYDEYEKYFELVKEEKKARKWEDWDRIHLLPLDKRAAFRHNGKTLEMICHNVKVKATCHPNDEFDLNKGIELAIARLKVKFAKIELENLIEKI